MNQRFQYRGTLEETSLPEMFYTVFRHRVPGLIELSNEGISKRITISDGTVVHASSTDRGDRLGAYLYRTGRLSREVLEETMRKRRGSNVRHGQIMIEDGLLSPGELYDAIRGQMESIVWSVFGWDHGEVAFRIGEFTMPSIRIHLPMRRVVMRGVQQVPNIKALAGRLGRRETVFRPNYSIEALLEIALDAKEYELLRLVDGTRTVYDICRCGPYAVTENARLLYAFHVLQLISRVEGRKNTSTGGVTIKVDADRQLADR